MKTKGKEFWNRLSILLIALAYLAVVIIAKEEWNKTQLVFLVFTLLAFCFAFARTFLGEDVSNGNIVFRTIDNTVFFIYLAIQFVIFGIIGVGVASFSYVTGLVIEIVITVISFIAMITINKTMNHSSSTEERVQEQVASDRLLIMRLNDVKTSDPQIRHRCGEIARELQNGFPVYPPEVAFITREICDSVNELEDMLISGNTVDAMKQTERIESLVKERATKARIYRR